MGGWSNGVMGWWGGGVVGGGAVEYGVRGMAERGNKNRGYQRMRVWEDAITPV
jgi:hypothetical protein